jgi:predicted Zn-dependent protease
MFFSTDRLFIALFVTLTIAGCSSNPSSSGGSKVVVGAQGRDVSIGDEMYQQMEAQGAIYDDEELQAYVNKIGQRLVAHSDMPNSTFTFTVIDAPDINAFATPGGFIYINRGLLAYLDSEDELAGVLSHEIGHITGRHHSRRKTASVTNKVLATTVYILTGSGDVAEASSMYGTELVSGYGREMELEADGYGAEYMHKAGYDTDALLEVIGVLKDQEQFQRVKAKSTGKKLNTYHGLYASHPRNDKRLQTVIAAANDLDDGSYIENPAVPGEFRSNIKGLVWGQSVQGKRDKQRYYHNKLGFTFKPPEGWNVDAGASAITAKAADNSASMNITLKRRDKTATPQQVLETSAKGTLSIGKVLDQAGLKGYTAVASDGNTAKRLGVVDFNYTFLFEGSASNFAASDPTLLSIIETFRPRHPDEKQTTTPRYIQYIQVPRGATIENLAASIRIPDAEAQLRLINGFYPRGEPRTGDWIKIIK